MNSRERLSALYGGRPIDRPPVMPITMMFAAGQAGVNYGRYTTDPAVLAEAQIQTSTSFEFDHVSAITETREAPDCGAAVRYYDDQPYALDESRSVLVDKNQLARLAMPDPLGGGRMWQRVLAIALLKERVGSEKWVEGWVEGSCGAAADLRGINRLMLDFHDDAAFVTDLFDFCLDLGIRFARAQAQAGADQIGIGDPAASLVGPSIYARFVWGYHKKLVDALHSLGVRVRLHICGNTKPLLGRIAELGCDVVDVDSVVPMAEARRRTGPSQALLGGIDPVRTLCAGPPDRIRQALAECGGEAGERYIVGAGCEIPPGTPAEHVRILAEYARSQARPVAEEG